MGVCRPCGACVAWHGIIVFAVDLFRLRGRVSGGGKLGKYVCMAVFLTVLWIAFWNQAMHVIDSTRRKSYSIGKMMACDARVLFEAMEQNAKEHEHMVRCRQCTGL